MPLPKTVFQDVPQTKDIWWERLPTPSPTHQLFQLSWQWLWGTWPMGGAERHSCFLLEYLWKSSTAVIYYLLLAKSPLPFSIYSLEKAVSLHGLCPSGVVNRNVPSSIFSEAHISSYGSGLDMGAFNRPRELVRTCPCVFGIELYILPVFPPWIPNSR